MNDPFKTHGAFSWFELLTNDVEEAKKFYTKLLGWETQEMSMSDDMKYNTIKAEGQDIGGIAPMPPQVPGGTPPHWGTYITVNDVDTVAKKAEELGGKILLPPMDVPEVGRFCHIQDPQGAVFAIITYAQQ